MQYRFMSQDEQDDILANALIQREKEHYEYEVNRVNYLAILDSMKSLPEDWPENIRKFRVLAGEALAQALPDPEDFSLACKLQFRDRVRLLLKTTIMEQQKVEHVYGALSLALPEGPRRAAAVQRVLSKEPQTPLRRQLRQVMTMLAEALSQRETLNHETNGRLPQKLTLDGGN